jgi:catechol 2,3-dioxygenase-like lactoylglutathione lyase family enzyme
VGLAKIAVLVPDVEAKVAILREQGLRPTNPILYRRYLSVLDPDGSTISLPESPFVGTEQMTHTHVSTVDVKSSNEFYNDLFGLPLRYESVPCEPLPASQGPGSDVCQWDSHLFSSRGDARFHIDVSHIHHPEASGEMLKPYAEANHLGIVRVGFEVDDLDASRAILLEDGRATDVGEPEIWDYGAGLGEQRVVTLRDPNGIRLELVQQKLVQPQQGCKNTDYNPGDIVF